MRLLAHRGSPVGAAAENTVPALQHALDSGADGVEVDLRLSADGVLVLSHDPDLERLAGRDLTIADHDWEQLREAAAERGVALARLEWALAAMAGRPIVLEVKAPPPAPGAVRRTALALVDRLQVLQAAGLPLDVTVSSFSPTVAAQVRSLAPAHIRTALLGRPVARPSAVLRQALLAGHDQIHPHVGALLTDPGCVRAAHATGVAVVPWTVNRGRALRRLAGLGVDAVITDVPVLARAALSTRRTPAA